MTTGLVELLVRRRLAGPAELRLAEHRAVSAGVPLVAVVAGTLVGEQALAEALSAEVGAPLVYLAQGAVDPEAIRRMPVEVAVRHLVIPVALEPSGEILRAAFSDPLDDEAVRAVERETGCRVEALVATVGEVRAAIDRHYGTVTTRIVRSPLSEIPRESTRRITRSSPPHEIEGEHDADPDAPVAALSTTPVHRLDSEATVEQRLDALLLALAEAGVVSHADYVRALRRILGRG